MSEYNFSYDDLDSMINSAASDFDFSNYFSGSGQDFDFGSLDPNAFSLDNIDSMINDAALGLGDFDFGDIDIGGLDLPQDFSFDPDTLSNIDMSATDLDAILDSMGAQGIPGLEDIDLGDARVLADMGQPFADSGNAGATRSMINLSEGAKTGGLGLTPTGRGQMSIRDPETGATGITAEGFTSVQDLLGSGTEEEIARYTPGTVDYSLRSGLETPGGLGLSSDATRGMSLDYMGGGQGISQYRPAEYSDSTLEDLVRRNPGKFGDIEDYLNKEIFGGKGLEPFRGTGGTVSQTGFLKQNSAANPLGAQYAIGDQASFVNRPSVTGQQASVAPNRTVIDNKNGTFNVVTEGGGNITTKTVDGAGKTIKTTTTNTATGEKTTTGPKTNTGTNPGAKAAAKNQSNMGALLPILLALLAMNKGGGGGGGNRGAVIPGLTATQRQTPYAQQQRAPGYRPGQGGINYFEQTQFTPRMAAGGGIGGLLNGPGDGVSDSIPAVIDGNMAGGGQPAQVARGEYIMDARTVAALGNGSTDAGAERLDKMRENILRDDRQTGVGEDSKAYRHLMA
jgi:hypothetical protein